ncbi:MAG: VanZ family protein [Clostridium sp.]
MEGNLRSHAVILWLHQLFVPGRAGRFSDVLIDSSGAALIRLLGPLFWRHDNEL